jgi:hypothetical protein
VAPSKRLTRKTAALSLPRRFPCSVLWCATHPVCANSGHSSACGQEPQLDPFKIIDRLRNGLGLRRAEVRLAGDLAAGDDFGSPAVRLSKKSYVARRSR